MIKAVIFDMDGVLIESEEAVWKSFNTLLKKEGVRFNNRWIKKYRGMSLKDQLSIWREKHGIKKYDEHEFAEKALQIQLKIMKGKIKPSKQLLQTLKELKKKNIKLAVATSSYKARAEKILSMLKIKKYFKTIIAAEDVKKHKPNPDVFLKAAEKLGVKPEDCVVIEDAANGIEAAKKGGMKAIGYAKNQRKRKELKNAEVLVSNFKQLNAKLRGYTRQPS